MAEKISSELKKKIKKHVDKAFEKIVEQATQGIEDFIKNLIVTKIMNIIGPLINRPVLKILANEGINKIVDEVWEKNREKIMKKIENIKNK